jgi:DNA-binding XRE family transcriptional regulator
VNKIELEVAVLRNQISLAALAEKIGMNKTTLYRKLESGKFDREEIVKIREQLNLTDADILRIFFNDDGCVNATSKEEGA